MLIASMSISICSTPIPNLLRNSIFNVAFGYTIPGRRYVTFCSIRQESTERLSYVHQLRGRDHRDVLKPIAAVGSGLETSMTDSKGGILTFKGVEITVESEDAEKIKLRVDLTGEDTQKAFDMVLLNLTRSAPPIPGFRRQKGGKTAKVPKNLLLDIIGRNRVTNFVIREIVTSAVAGYVEEEKLTLKDDKINTTQTEDELKQSFVPGNAFGFNVELELINEETESETASAETESGTASAETEA
ncbi:uncharacterized protein LOC110718267 [Chenopodium quinoa]|uniref:uncharacterized protein LOC110718267 n=1 Tax=Chenopodium quinoa TaxID=63459 RepID=UPI000B7848B6|nr:uncharacterized protein LOC110718267 [Chenopodium quinoa]